jgi:acetyltransferase-like isoleucine patch superfamily enzyme
LGGNVVVLPGVTIGKGVTVGAGSVVTRDVGDFCVVVGNPARVIRKIEDGGVDGKFLEAEKVEKSAGGNEN